VTACAGSRAWRPISLLLLVGLLLSSGTAGEDEPARDPERDAGFAGALGQAFPMTPDMIHDYREASAETAAAILTRREPVPLIDTLPVWLEPGSAAPVLRLAPGIASVVGFYDRTGLPWPVRQYVIGDGDAYDVVQLGEESNTLAIAPRARVGWSNLVVALMGEPAPVVLRIRIGVETAHFRSAIQVMKSGPNAPAVTDDGGRIRAGDAKLLAALIGYDLPEAAQKLHITGIEADVWLLGDELLLRTRNPLLSPAWSAHMAAPDGVRAYRLKHHSHLLLAAGDRIIRARITVP